MNLEYSVIIDIETVLFKRQVDDFKVACTTERTANILFDRIDDMLTFHLKKMGLVTMFNGIDVQQTRHWIKISVQTYIERICEKNLTSWMKMNNISHSPTPLPHKHKMLQDILHAKGYDDPKVQATLAKINGFGYRNGIGELIYAIITCQTDL